MTAARTTRVGGPRSVVRPAGGPADQPAAATADTPEQAGTVNDDGAPEWMAFQPESPQATRDAERRRQYLTAPELPRHARHARRVDVTLPEG